MNEGSYKLEWLEGIKKKYDSLVSWVFVVHGNTGDLQMLDKESVTNLDNILKQYLRNIRDCVGIYDRTKGLTWVDKASEEIARSFIQIPSTGPGGGALQSARNNAQGDPFERFKDPLEAFALIDKMLRSSESGKSCSFILDYPECLLSSDGWGKNPLVDVLTTYIRKWALDSEISNTGNAVILLCRDAPGSLHPSLLDLEGKIEQIYVKYPDKEQRMNFLTHLWDDVKPIPEEDDDDDDETAESLVSAVENLPEISEIATQTAGLSLSMVEDCILRCRLEKKYDPVFIKERKDEIIRATYDDIIEIMEPSVGWESVGGLDNVIEFLTNSVVKPLKEGNSRRCPMGILMVGPPGTGKSITAEALAYEAGVLFVKLNFAKIFSKWIGDSERNLDRALQAIVALSPAIVFIDEIDQSGHRRDGASSGDSGVSQRVFQKLLSFMADTRNRGKIVFAAATNRPDLLDPAMKRAGRFDKKIPFLAPDEVQREGILRALGAKIGCKMPKKIPPSVIEQTSGYVGADLETIITAAFELADDDSDDNDVVITGKNLEEACRYLRPSISAESIDEMTYLALAECNDTRLIPKKYLNESMKSPKPKKAALTKEVAKAKWDRSRRLSKSRGRVTPSSEK